MTISYLKADYRDRPPADEIVLQPNAGRFCRAAGITSGRLILRHQPLLQFPAIRRLVVEWF